MNTYILRFVFSLTLVATASPVAWGNPLEDQINKDQDLVLISDVSYGGTPFLARRSNEPEMAESRATQVCKVLGHGVAVHQVVTNANPKAVHFWEVSLDGHTIYITSDYGNSSSSPTRVFSMIACRKKSANEKPEYRLGQSVQSESQLKSNVGTERAEPAQNNNQPSNQDVSL